MLKRGSSKAIKPIPLKIGIENGFFLSRPKKLKLSDFLRKVFWNVALFLADTPAWSKIFFMTFTKNKNDFVWKKVKLCSWRCCIVSYDIRCIVWQFIPKGKLKKVKGNSALTKGRGTARQGWMSLSHPKGNLVFTSSKNAPDCPLSLWFSKLAQSKLWLTILKFR